MSWQRIENSAVLIMVTATEVLVCDESHVYPLVPECGDAAPGQFGSEVNHLPCLSGSNAIQVVIPP
jgi:hypothetical protein